MGGINSKNGSGAAAGGDSGADSQAGTAGAGAGPINSVGAGGSAAAGAASGAAPVGVESLGVVGSPDQLIAEAEAAAAGAPQQVDPSQPAGELNPNGQWSALTPPLVKVTCAVVLPAWQIRDDEQTEVSEALGQCLEQLFPGGIEGKYACWVRLVFCCGAITVSRVQQHGRLPPLFLPKASAAKPAAQPTPPRDPMTITSLTE